MAPYRWPNPRERLAETYRQAREYRDRERPGRYGRAGFGHRHGFHGAYADRPGYRRSRSESRGPSPTGSGWPHPIHDVAPDAVARHVQARADRELAREVDAELYHSIGRAADAVAVYADDAVITLEGALPHPALADRAVETARRMRGVRGVRDGLSLTRRA